MKKSLFLVSILMLGFSGLQGIDKRTVVKLGVAGAAIVGIKALEDAYNPDTCLRKEIERGDSPEKVHEWLKKGARARGHKNYSPAVLAAEKGRLGTLKALHEHDAYSLIQSNGKDSALTAAVRHNHADILHYIISLDRTPMTPNMCHKIYGLYKVAQTIGQQMDDAAYRYIDPRDCQKLQYVARYKENNERIQKLLFDLAPEYITEREKKEREYQELQDSRAHLQATGEYTAPVFVAMMQERLPRPESTQLRSAL